MSEPRLGDDYEWRDLEWAEHVIRDMPRGANWTAWLAKCGADHRRKCRAEDDEAQAWADMGEDL